MNVPVCSIVWFRQDLRLADNPALLAAASRGAVIPVFIWSPDEDGGWPPGAASRWWLHQSLASLHASLQQHGSRFILRHGPTVPALRELIEQTGASAIYYNRRFEPAARQLEVDVQTELRHLGVNFEGFQSALLHDPEKIRTKSGTPYQVFSAFWRCCLAQSDHSEPAPAPSALRSPSRWPSSTALQEFRLEPTINWTSGMRAAWKPGEAEAQLQLHRFLRQGLSSYATERDRPDREGTSRLSPHLHFGEISPRQIWFAMRHLPSQDSLNESTTRYHTELGWREFAHYLLFHFPHTTDEPLRTAFASFPWLQDGRALKAWQRGRTGFPIVDAGMRELWHSGWMHNRVRMIVASFLTKDLLLPWQSGTAWFWDTLVDADLANNTLGWQWTAGCGADAAPFFRVFNPVSQGQRFDPAGDYVRRWVPELTRLPEPWIHEPWNAPESILEAAGVALGSTYPRPIVDHATARSRALKAYRGLATNK